MSKLIRVLFYGSITREEYDSIEPMICEVNKRYLLLTSILGVICTTLMFVLSLLVTEFKGINNVYLFGIITSLTILLGVLFIVKRYYRFTYVLTWVAIEFFMVYAIFVSVVKHFEYPGVTFMVLLVFMTIVYLNRPLNTICLVTSNIIIYDVLCFYTKTHEYFIIDLVNSIVFGLLSFVWCCMLTSTRIRDILKDKTLLEFANLDQLTQLNNRNCYEVKLKQYERVYNTGITCIYIDVNGLHELNNSKGHDAGDEMLRFIAEQIKRYFGIEHSYRVGGDEYIVFVLHKSKPSVQDSLINFRESVEKANYSISIGVSHKLGRCDINDLVKKAETKMFESKNKYYETHKR